MLFVFYLIYCSVGLLKKMRMNMCQFMIYMISFLSLSGVIAVGQDQLQRNDSSFSSLDQTSVLFIATSKNSAEFLPDSLLQLDRFSLMFKDARMLFYTDDNNKDATEALLRDYVARSPNTRQLLVEKNQHRRRTQRIAQARNRLLETASEQGYLDAYDVVIHLDIDDVMAGSRLTAESLGKALHLMENSDVVCSNSAPHYYYDRWALRTDLNESNCNAEKTCNGDLSRWFGSSYRGQYAIDVNSQPIQVQSCFGGFALYKSSTLSQCMRSGQCRYQGITKGIAWKSVPECEHVSFHRALREHAGAKIVIDPQLDASSEELDVPRRLQYFVNDLTWASFADYVFSSQPKSAKNYIHGVEHVYGKWRPVRWDGVKVIFVTTGDLPLFFSSWMPKIQSPFVLLSAGEVYSMPGELSQIRVKGFLKRFRLKSLNMTTILSNPNLKGWYTQNLDDTLSHPKLHALPLGLGYKSVVNRDFSYQSGMSAINQERSMLKIVDQLPPTYKRKRHIYSDTHLNDTSKRHKVLGLESRLEVYDKIKENPLIDFQDGFLDRQTQWKKRSEYMFSLSLIGNGFDCLRTWESLVLGNIVLLQSSPLDPLFEGLPVVIIKDWSEINDANLTKWAKQYGDAFTNPKYREKLTSLYWVSKIRAEMGIDYGNRVLSPEKK